MNLTSWLAVAVYYKMELQQDVGPPLLAVAAPALLLPLPLSLYQSLSSALGEGAMPRHLLRLGVATTGSIRGRI